MTSRPIHEVFLLRHTQTTWNAISRYQGRIDTPLSDLGQRQVETIASLVTPGAFQTVFMSPLRRAGLLAEAVAAAAEVGIVVDDRLTEIGMGPWEGLTRTEIEARFPLMLAAWHYSPDTVTFPGGETLGDVASRVSAFMEERFADTELHRIAVVTHDSVVKVAVMLALGLDLSHLHRFRMRNGSISVLRGRRYAGSVETVDSVSHLTGSPFELVDLT